MKVESGNIGSQVSISNAAKDKKVGDKAESAVAKSTGDLGASAKVDISERAQQINKIKEMASPDVDTIREDKVAHFQKMIDNGEYSVDASSVADRLVDNHLFR